MRLSPKFRRAAVAAFVVAAVALASTGGPAGEVFFTGLDDSAQSILARTLRAGAPLVFHDLVFEEVPPEVRPGFLYRPAAARKTRDLARQTDPSTCAARPFFQPFLPLQRSFLPRLPGVLWGFALAAVALAAMLPPAGAFRCRNAAVRIFFAGVLAVAWLFLTPWHSAHYLAGPYAEGPATLFSALAMALAFAPGGGAWRGAAVGLFLGLSVAFHPFLSAFAVPVAAFSVMRSGRPRHVAGLAAGAAAGLAPLVWSTLCVTAPYGNFLSPRTVAEMVRGSRDIAVLAAALAAAVPAAAVSAAAALNPRVRTFFAGNAARTAAAAVSAAVVAGAAVFLCVHPAASRGFAHDSGALVRGAPFFAAALALALAKRRGASCAFVAACAWASIPFFAVQGQEVHVGLWSLRRALAPVVLCSVALAGAAFESAAPEDPPRRAAAFASLGRAVAFLALLCGLSGAVSGRGFPEWTPANGGARLANDVLSRIADLDARNGADGVFLFDSFRYGAPFAAVYGLDAFCLSDAVSRDADPSRAAEWLGSLARGGKPAYAVVSREAAVPIPENGFTLVPEGAPVTGRLSRVEGKNWRDARTVSRDACFSFLRVVPDDDPEAPDGAVLDFSGYDAFPFGLRGGWDRPRRGKPGRWACDGAGFCAPVPPSGGTVAVEIDAAWTPPGPSAGKAQTVRLVPPFETDGPAEAELAPGRKGSTLRFSVRRNVADSADRGSSGVWKISVSEKFDAPGYPPDLAILVFAVRTSRSGNPPTW